MSKKEILEESSLHPLSLPQIKRETVTVRSAHQEEKVIEVPLLFQKDEEPFTAGNKQAIRVLRDTVLEASEIVCIAIKPHERLQFAWSFSFI